MIGSTLKLALIDNIEPRTEPVLSLYLDVYRANPDNASIGTGAQRRKGVSARQTDRTKSSRTCCVSARMVS